MDARLPRQTLAWTLSIALAGVCPSRAEPRQPPTITLDGGSSVPLAGRATRAHFLGAVELYSLAVYAAAPLRELSLVASPDVPKILRIEVKYKDDLRRRAPLDWRRELVPRLNADAASVLHGTFAPLRYGDVALIEYLPDKGTTVRVNRSVAVSEASHDLMLAFLDHWLGQRPVSEEIKHILLTGSGH